MKMNALESLARIPWLHYWEQRIFGLQFYRWVKTVLKTQGVLESTKPVLEVGCGTGIISRWLQRGLYVGIDTDISSLQFASRNGRARCVCDDASHLSFRDATFEYVISVGVLHHLDDVQTQEHFRESLRVLRPNGTLIVLDSLKPDPKDRFRYWFSTLERGAFLRTPDQLTQCLSRCALPSSRYQRVKTFFLQNYSLLIEKEGR